MWRELWEEHRSRAMAAAGVGLFLVAGWGASALAPQDDVPRARQDRDARRDRDARGDPQEARAVHEEALHDEARPASWRVYVSGNVRRPGVYPVSPGSRIIDLVNAAGGTVGDADIVVVNMAQPLFDGQQVHVPARGEIDLGIAAPAPPALAVRAPGRPARRSDGRIDINRATAEELTQLKGVGPLLAERIVEHRERHGPFDSVEDLLQVRGIGTSKLKGLRDRAIVAP